ncbi:ArsR/SmtB family transcription factor [Streptomyces hirsutus]|uniref:ArsR/SmtB family transcription factor n=1 Tax=Streptomyces hirsutus TaxID=35620 RepID=UPI00367CCBA5
MRNDELDEWSKALDGVASPVRRQILRWLRDPVSHFPPQVDGDLLTEGVCSDFIREKLGLAASTTSRHLNLLTEAGLLVATRKKGWTFYRRDEATIHRFTTELREGL